MSVLPQNNTTHASATNTTQNTTNSSTTNMYHKYDCCNIKIVIFLKNAQTAQMDKYRIHMNKDMTTIRYTKCNMLFAMQCTNKVVLRYIA